MEVNLIISKKNMYVFLVIKKKFQIILIKIKIDLLR